jgi:hypothetical protein
MCNLNFRINFLHGSKTSEYSFGVLKGIQIVNQNFIINFANTKKSWSVRAQVNAGVKINVRNFVSNMWTKVWLGRSSRLAFIFSSIMNECWPASACTEFNFNAVPTIRCLTKHACGSQISTRQDRVCSRNVFGAIIRAMAKLTGVIVNAASTFGFRVRCFDI